MITILRGDRIVDQYPLVPDHGFLKYRETKQLEDGMCQAFKNLLVIKEENGGDAVKLSAKVAVVDVDSLVVLLACAEKTISLHIEGKIRLNDNNYIKTIEILRSADPNVMGRLQKIKEYGQ